jgi:hypothetical protein
MPPGKIDDCTMYHALLEDLPTKFPPECQRLLNAAKRYAAFEKSDPFALAEMAITTLKSMTIISKRFRRSG